MAVLCVCKENPAIYCKYWDGIGDPNQAQARIQCPKNVKTCQYIVAPKPSAPLKAS